MRRMRAILWTVSAAVVAVSGTDGAQEMTWNALPPMNVARISHDLTTLADGRVLATGGILSGGYTETASCEIYDPVERRWTPAASLPQTRVRHAAVLLENGLVLLSGGTSYSVTDAQAFLYDPSQDTWTLAAPRARASVGRLVLLPSGKALFFGTAIPMIPETYDPSTDTWASGVPLPPSMAGNTGNTLTLLSNGKALAAGGSDPRAAVYDPSTGESTPTGPLVTQRYSPTASLLPDGRVLLAGGQSIYPQATIRATELYDPSTNTWTAGPPMNEARQGHSATVLPSGEVLIVGGSAGGVCASAELFAGSAFSMTAPLEQGRTNHRAALLPDLTLMVAGGYGGSSGLPTVENYVASRGALQIPDANGPESTAMAFTVTLTEGGLTVAPAKEP